MILEVSSDPHNIDGDAADRYRATTGREILLRKDYL
jgi:hypothetical protein